MPSSPPRFFGRGVYPEPFPYCHPERSEGSQGKGRDSSVAEFTLSQILRSLRSLRMTKAKGSFRMTLSEGLAMTRGLSALDKPKGLPLQICKNELILIDQSNPWC